MSIFVALKLYINIKSYYNIINLIEILIQEVEKCILEMGRYPLNRR